MKRVNYLLVGLLSLSSLIGCSKDDDHNGGMGENSGDLYAAFSINTGGPGTYATPEEEAAKGVADEGHISDVKIYVFNGERLEVSGAITMPTAGGVGTSTLSVTTGKKTVYALVNSTEITLSVTDGTTTLTDFKAALEQALEIGKLTGAKKFTMFGVGEITIGKTTNDTEDKAKANPCKINVNRVSAKVSFVYSNAVKDDFVGDFTSPAFALNQTHTKISISRELRTGALTSADGVIDYTPTKPVKADQVATDGTYDHLTVATAPITYIAAEDNLTAATAIAKSLYCIENINETPTTGNSTFVIVQLKFAPKEGTSVTTVVGDFSTFATTTKITEADESFYVVTLADKTKHIFATQDEADAAIPANPELTGGDVKKHIAGLGYYRLNLNNKQGVTEFTKRYSVLRNHLYHVNIKNVNSVGAGDPDELIPTEPETPIETNAHITADITVLPWTVITMDEDLD